MFEKGAIWSQCLAGFLSNLDPLARFVMLATLMVSFFLQCSLALVHTFCGGLLEGASRQGVTFQKYASSLSNAMDSLRWTTVAFVLWCRSDYCRNLFSAF